jgi:hypothetical protein
MRAAKPRLKSPATPSPDAARWRRATELLNRATDLRRLAVAFPGMRIIGPDPLVETLEKLCGLADAGLVILRVRLRQNTFTVVAASPRAWRAPGEKARLHVLKRTAEHAGHRILLVPPRSIARQPRLDNSRWIASCAGVRVMPEERSAIATYLYSAPCSSLTEVASRLRRRDAASAILSLVAAGDIELDLNRPIRPTSQLKLIRHHLPDAPPEVSATRSFR